MKEHVIQFFVMMLMFSGFLCCAPKGNQTIAIEKSSCTLTNQSGKVVYTPDSTKTSISGTEWIAQFDPRWKVILHDIEEERELIVEQKNFKTVKNALASVFVVPWAECPAKFISNAADTFIISNKIIPIKDAIVEINGRNWYVFSFIFDEEITGIFAATANGNHGFILECAAFGNDDDDKLEVCADFIASFVITTPKLDSVRKKDNKTIEL